MGTRQSALLVSFAIAITCSAVEPAAAGRPTRVQRAARRAARRPPAHLTPRRMQRATWDEVLRRSRAARRGSWVLIDLDHSALLPRLRTEAAMRRAGRAHGIRELERPELWRLVPSTSARLFRRFWSTAPIASGPDAGRTLAALHPSADLDAVYESFRLGLLDPMLADVPGAPLPDEMSPGLRQRIGDLRAAGVRIGYLTGRGELMRDKTVRSLRRARVAPRRSRDRLFMRRNRSRLADAEEKVAVAAGVPGGRVVAIIDNEGDNLTALGRLFPGALLVWVRHPDFATDEPPAGWFDLAADRGQIQTFKRR